MMTTKIRRSRPVSVGGLIREIGTARLVAHGGPPAVGSEGFLVARLFERYCPLNQDVRGRYTGLVRGSLISHFGLGGGTQRVERQEIGRSNVRFGRLDGQRRVRVDHIAGPEGGEVHFGI